MLLVLNYLLLQKLQEVVRKWLRMLLLEQLEYLQEHWLVLVKKLLTLQLQL
jgi:hypothetical protein